MKTTPSTYLYKTQQIAGQITDWRRDLHRHPELPGYSPSPVMLLRFDMDALPIMEENQVEYVSQNPDVMHARGHDTHIAMGLGRLWGKNIFTTILALISMKVPCRWEPLCFVLLPPSFFLEMNQGMR